MNSLVDSTTAERVAASHRPPTASLEPLGARVLIRPDAPEAVSAGGVLLPDAAQEKPCQGVVLAAGPHCYTLGVGDRVLFPKYTGTDVEVDGELLLMVKESDIEGRFKPRLSVE